jgi:hypothetical protein
VSTYFSDASFKFLRGLARHNDKAWFNDHRQQYEDHVRQPFLRLLTDLQPDLAEISDHFRPTRAVGGSLFRIYRDARFSNDKSPYKTWQGARLFHERRAKWPRPRSTCTCSRARASSAPACGTPSRTRSAACASSSSTTRAAGRPPRIARCASASTSRKREAGAPAARFPGRFRVHRRPQAPQLGVVALAGRRHDDRPAPAPDPGQGPGRTRPFVDYLCAALDLEF